MCPEVNFSRTLKKSDCQWLGSNYTENKNGKKKWFTVKWPLSDRNCHLDKSLKSTLKSTMLYWDLGDFYAAFLYNPVVFWNFYCYFCPYLASETEFSAKAVFVCFSLLAKSWNDKENWSTCERKSRNDALLLPQAK